jgi:predicted lactoylglutathione lyase
MLIPTGGFDWVTGDHAVAANGCSECVLTLTTASNDDADQLVERALTAGAAIVTAPGQQPWGYAGAFADLDGHIWMVRSDGSAA